MYDRVSIVLFAADLCRYFLSLTHSYGLIWGTPHFCSLLDRLFMLACVCVCVCARARAHVNGTWSPVWMHTCTCHCVYTWCEWMHEKVFGVYVLVYVCARVCLCCCTYFICITVYVCQHVHACKKHVCVCICVRMYVRNYWVVCACACVCVCGCACVCVHACMQMQNIFLSTPCKHCTSIFAAVTQHMLAAARLSRHHW